MEQKESDFYKRTAEVFLKNGIREITMDDMAKELKVSKKTLYKYVSDRAELVTKSMMWKMSENINALTTITSKNLNAVEELCEITNFYCGNLKGIHPSIHIDLNKYYLEAWNCYVDYRNTFLYSLILSNLEKGVAQGLYRSNFNAEVITKIFISKVDSVFDPKIFPSSKFEFSEVYLDMMRYHFKGIVSAEGLAMVKNVLGEKCNLTKSL